MTPSQPTAILLVSCPDQRGIVAALSAFITQHNGNIIALDQYVDSEESAFFARMEWELDGFAFPLEQFAARFEPVARPRRIEWRLHLSDRRLRMAVMVSRQAHCLYDILARWESGEWPIELSLVLSNHDDHRGLVERHGLPFHHIPVEAATKAEAEDRQIALLKQANVDFIVLARYMQILGPSFVQTFPMRILNIHHSFLPAFAGAHPYRAAHDRGVKIIGATAHFVTEKLDEGPIIEQDVIRVSHRQGVDDLVRLGRDLEKIVLSRAIYWHVHHRILVYKNRTVVFS
ncbi:MAG: formyltetrahydrofolate deformylase [Lentisphaerae bacterium]|jgi:formyltetrahydrofolate deformylase|nr:formyltetrahydrofolate deformylase [Lentisphaerota bacterium]HQN80538.1 formyltetrahydrofolate deformylase [Kiritimatiellia bacterium]HQQ60875.1 formyltetrahydrofolate deformylase [Kiritimatiellia bacterium]